MHQSHVHHPCRRPSAPRRKSLKDLGVHTEMFSDGLIDLIEPGVVNGEKKRTHPGKVVSSFVMGTRRLYDFIDDNPYNASTSSAHDGGSCFCRLFFAHARDALDADAVDDERGRRGIGDDERLDGRELREE